MASKEASLSIATAPEKKGKQAVLSSLDDAKFQWFHVKAILISGVGFFTDAYDLYNVSIITPMLALAYYPLGGSKNASGFGSLPNNLNLAVKGTALVGTLCGQILFGMLGDRGGRKKSYGWTLVIMIFATLMCAGTTLGPANTAIGVFCMWRFILGLGIGGDYPLSATITSEYAPVKYRGAMIAAVFAGQGVGYITASIVSICTIAAMKTYIEDCRLLEECEAVNTTWRIIVAIGAIPAAATWYLRMKLPEPPRYTAVVDENEEKAENDVMYVMNVKQKDHALKAQNEGNRTSFRSFCNFIFRWSNFQILLGTAMSWFLLDIAYYGQGMFIDTILADIDYAPSLSCNKAALAPYLQSDGYYNFDSYNGTVPLATVASCSDGSVIYDKVYKTAAGNAAVTMMGTVPGYFFCIAFVELMGRKTIQYMGFVLMTILFVIISSAYDALHANHNTVWVFMLLYALTFFFANFGPNSTTFILPGEVFPTKYRATCHGISAAMGKLGAIVGTYGFGYLYKPWGTHIPPKTGSRFVAGMLAIVMAAGIPFTYFVPETKGKTLEELGRVMLRNAGEDFETPPEELHDVKVHNIGENGNGKVVA